MRRPPVSCAAAGNAAINAIAASIDLNIALSCGKEGWPRAPAGPGKWSDMKPPERSLPAGEHLLRCGRPEPERGVVVVAAGHDVQPMPPGIAAEGHHLLIRGREPAGGEVGVVSAIGDRTAMAGSTTAQGGDRLRRAAGKAARGIVVAPAIGEHPAAARGIAANGRHVLAGEAELAERGVV